MIQRDVHFRAEENESSTKLHAILKLKRYRDEGHLEGYSDSILVHVVKDVIKNLCDTCLGARDEGSNIANVTVSIPRSMKQGTLLQGFASATRDISHDTKTRDPRFLPTLQERTCPFLFRRGGTGESASSVNPPTPRSWSPAMFLDAVRTAAARCVLRPQ